MKRAHDQILCPKCHTPWHGDESDAILAVATCTNCGQFYRADEITMFVTKPLQERWVTREGSGGWAGTWGGVRHRTREAAEKTARRYRWPFVCRVLFSADSFTTLETFEVRS